MTLILSTPTTSRPIADGYKPDALPPRAILHDWLRVAGNTMSMETLVSNLKSGQPFAFGMEGTISWIQSLPN